MITIPVYELLLLPEVTFFFKKDMFPEGRIKEQNIGEEILFVLQKKEPQRKFPWKIFFQWA